MVSKDIFGKLPGALLPWYRENRRDLPWRADKDPYHIWLSEIMLQQTRVEAVRGYYGRFLQHIPTIEALAAVDDGLLLKLWEGLGYYSRARNLKKAAIAIMENHGGAFPKSYEQVLSLSGIGSYTAGAICSIAYDLPTPAVDGNVLRVIARLTNDETPVDTPSYKASVCQRLCEIYPANAGDFTQALMELGATICGPNKAPDCEHCPCKDFCLGKNCQPERLPIRLPKRQRRQEDMTVLILSCEGKYALQKREDNGLLASLWQFPNVPGKKSVDEILRIAQDLGLRPREILRQVERKHIFTHVQWNMRGFYMEVGKQLDGFLWLSPAEIEKQIALPTAFRQFYMEIAT